MEACCILVSKLPVGRLITTLHSMLSCLPTSTSSISWTIGTRSPGRHPHNHPGSHGLPCPSPANDPMQKRMTAPALTHSHTLRKQTILQSFEGPVSLAERLQRHVASFGRLQGRLHLLILGELEILVQLLKPFLHGQQEVNDVLNHSGCSLQHMTTSRDETLLLMFLMPQNTGHELM